MNEIHSYKNTLYTEEPVQTIYFGGGTPSRLPPRQIGLILKTLQSVFDVQAHEITLEMNPDDVTAHYLSGLKQAGITRASMGVQSFQPELLEFMNRAHTRGEALRCLEMLHSSGFEAFTADLIYGNPNQTKKQLSKDLDLLLAFDPPHISAYSLTVEPNTRLGKQLELGRLNPLQDRAVAEQFELIGERLAEQNTRRYEVSNYSKAGKEATHNSNYWNHKNYIGFGPGAHSFWWKQKSRRWHNKADIRAYLNEDGFTGQTEELSLTQLAEERLMMGLRTREGISEGEMSKTYDYSFNERQKDYLREQQSHDHLAWDAAISLTSEGLIIADAIILDLISLHER